MDFIPLAVKANCILDDAGLFEHIRLAMERDLPVALGGKMALVGSGPSVKGELESIRKLRAAGVPIAAIKDAHDWLIGEGLIPDYAIAVDPQEHRWNCFRKKHPGVTYLIASQCHPAMFEHLKDMDVRLWHLYIREGQTYPPDSMLVTGGTTSGLRAITLFYAMGYRQFELFGYDSCLQEDKLRMDGTTFDRPPIEIFVGDEKKRFLTTPEMAAQATEFQNLYQVMPDMDVVSHGDGVITAILASRKAARERGVVGTAKVASGLYDMNPWGHLKPAETA